MRVTETLFLASFIMVALISMKVIGNRDNTIINLKQLHKKDSTINAVNYSNHLKDSIAVSNMPPVNWEVDKKGIVNLNYN